MKLKQSMDLLLSLVLEDNGESEVRRETTVAARIFTDHQQDKARYAGVGFFRVTLLASEDSRDDEASDVQHAVTEGQFKLKQIKAGQYLIGVACYQKDSLYNSV